jgi:hypothetical protein
MPVTEQPTVTSGVSELPLVTKGAPAKITCVSLVPNANDEWCQTVCGSGGRCPGNVCRCSHDGVPFDAGDQQQQAVPTHGKAPLERSASAPPVTHNGKPLPPADGPPLTRSPKLAHVGKGPHPGGNHPKHQGQYQATALLSEEAQLRQQVTRPPSPDPYNPDPPYDPDPDPVPDPDPDPDPDPTPTPPPPPP